MKSGKDGVVQNDDVTTVSVLCADIAKIAYVGYVDSASGQSSTAVLGIDSVSGSPTLTQTLIGTVAPEIFAAGGLYAYAPFGEGIAGFAIDQLSGGLAALAGSPYGVGTVPPYPQCTTPPGYCHETAPKAIHLVADPSREHIYAYFRQMGPCCPTIPVVSIIVGFAVDPATGVLTELAVPAVRGGNPTVGMTTDPGGRFLYSADAPNFHIVDQGGIAHYTIDDTTGELTLAGTDVAFTWPLTFEPRGNFAYAADSMMGAAQAFAVDPASGALTHTGLDSPASGLSALTADPAGAFAYGACTGGICAFSLDAATGVLTALAGNPFATGTSPTSLVLDPSGKFAFAICAESICVYELNPTTGTPNLTPASPFTITNTVPLSILVTN